jgi:sporulation protein YlmC with PRC-barrel domain
MLSTVLLLSRISGQQVLTREGRAVGRLQDLTVRLDASGTAHLVERLLVRRASDGRIALADWDTVTDFRTARVVLSSEPDGLDTGLAEALAPDEILLKRDVLDTQIVDVVGQRLARVADVVLARTADGRLELLGVEVGFSGVLRRLGVRRPPAGEDIVAWSDLHLTSERGHAVQLSTPRAAVHRLDARGLAALVSRMDTDSATEILAAKEPAVAADTVRSVHPEVGERMLRAMPRQLAERIVASMPAEYAGRWRHRLTRHQRWRGRRFLRSGVWPHRRHLIREPRR